MEHSTDKFFRDKLESYASPVQGKVWDNIAISIGPPTSEKKKWLWLFLFFLIFSIGLFFLWMNYNTGAEDSKGQDALAMPNEMKSMDFIDPDHSSTSIAVINKEDNKHIIDLEDHRDGAEIVANSTHDRLETGLRIAAHNMPALREAALPVSDQTLTETGGSDKIIMRQGWQGSVLPKRPMKGIAFKFPRFGREKTLGDCFEGPPSRYFVAFHASADYPFRKLDAGGNSELANYLSQRKGTESSMLSFHLGLSAAYIHPSGWMAKTGLQYTQLNERFLLIRENVIKRQTHITIDTVYNTDGSFTIFKDTSIVEVLGIEKLQTDNLYSMMDVPLLLGYHFHFDRFSLEVITGAIFNIVSFQKGRIYNGDLVPTYYNSRGPSDFSPYKTHVGISLYGSLSFLSRIDNRTQFFLEPHARYYISSFTRHEYPLRQNYLVAGLATGIRYYF